MALANSFSTNASSNTALVDLSKANVAFFGTPQSASNPPPGIQPGQCWHPGHGLGGRGGMQWINSWIAPCGSPGSRGPV